MVELKELLQGNKIISIKVENEEYGEFLNYAKRQDCLWKNGDIIEPQEDKAAHHTDLVVITEDLLIYHPYSYVSGMILGSYPRYLFADMKKDIIADDRIAEKVRRDELFEEMRKEHEEAERQFKKLCEENRKISRLQLLKQDR